MNRIKIGLIIFCAFLSVNAAGSNPSFNDTISIPGAKCIISTPTDSNSLWSLPEHPCNNYYFFKTVLNSPFLLISFSSSVKCTLFVIGTFNEMRAIYNSTDTLPLSCDSLKYLAETRGCSKFGCGVLVTDTSGNYSLAWEPDLVDKRLATVNVPDFFGNLLHFVIKSANDSSEVYLSRSARYYTPVINTQFSKPTNNTKYLTKAYTINGALIQSNHRLPALYILRDNTTAQPTVHFFNKASVK